MDYSKPIFFFQGRQAFLNSRKQILFLLQDDLTVTAAAQWRVQTNGTISIDSSGSTATLTIEDKKMQVQILAGPSGAKFQDLPSARTANAPQLHPGSTDQDNSPAHMLAIDIPVDYHPSSPLDATMERPELQGCNASERCTCGLGIRFAQVKPSNDGYFHHHDLLSRLCRTVSTSVSLHSPFLCASTRAHPFLFGRLQGLCLLGLVYGSRIG